VAIHLSSQCLIPNLYRLQKELEKIEAEGKELDRIESEMIKKEKKTPWNVDTISKPGFEKTVINKKAGRKPDENLSEEEREQRMKQFVKENEKLCQQYGMLRKYDDSKRFLQEHLHLVGEETANYLVIWSINLEMEEKHELMAHVAHQCICMQYILELAKQLDVDPRACVSSFFSKIQHCHPEYRAQFDSEIEGFKGRIQKRAQEKIQEAIAQAEEEERKERLGPGGLDPADVFESLPDVRSSDSLHGNYLTNFSCICSAGTKGLFRVPRRRAAAEDHCGHARGRRQAAHEALCGLWSLGAQCR